jgi:hypothetical protein
MSTQFVPYSVTMRSRGYVRVPRTQQWVPECVLERRQFLAEIVKMSAPIRDMVRTDPIHLALENGATWGDLAQQAQDRMDAPFVSMTDDEWHAYLRADKSKPWEECRRIMRLRAANKATEHVEPEAPKTCAYWYREYTQFPHLYFASPEEQKQAIADVLADWRNEKGRWRVGAMDAAARAIQQAWKTYRQANAFYFVRCECDLGTPCQDCVDYQQANAFDSTPCDCESGGRRCQDCMNYELTAHDCQYCGAVMCDGYDCRFPHDASAQKCYCGDWVCAGDCGVLRCGCIDMCRCGHD